MNGTNALTFDRVLMEAIQDMVFVVRVEKDSLFIYEFFNRAVTERTDLDQQALGKTFWEVQSEELAVLLNEQYEKVLANRECQTYEDSYLSPSGELYYGETRLTPLFDDSGQCTRIVGIVKDITNEKLTEAESQEYLERLKESRSRFRSLYDNNADAVFTLDLNGRILGGNEAVETITGYAPDELIDTELIEHIVTDQHMDIQNLFQQAIEGNIKNCRTKFVGKDSELIGCLIKITPIEVRDEVVGVFAVLKDMRELEEVFRKYNESEKNFRIIAENVHDVIVLMDHQGKTLYVSPSSKEVYGFEAEEYEEKPPFYNLHPEDFPLVDQLFSQAIHEAKTYKAELRLKHKTKGWVWAELHGTPVFDEQNRFIHMMTISRDITLQKEQEAKLEFLAYHDSLTGLPNRRFFRNCLKDTISQVKKDDERVTIILLDIDHFKSINDQLGHEIGDAVIEEFSKRLKQAIGDADIAARLGGDEFILLLPGSGTEAQAMAAAKNIQRAMEVPWHIQDTVLQVTTSMGVSISPLKEATPSSLVKNADIALYEAKEAGRNTFRIHQI